MFSNLAQTILNFACFNIEI